MESRAAWPSPGKQLSWRRGDRLVLRLVVPDRFGPLRYLHSVCSIWQKCLLRSRVESGGAVWFSTADGLDRSRNVGRETLLQDPFLQ